MVVVEEVEVGIIVIINNMIIILSIIIISITIITIINIIIMIMIMTIRRPLGHRRCEIIPRPSLVGLRARASALDPGIR